MLKFILIGIFLLLVNSNSFCESIQLKTGEIIDAKITENTDKIINVNDSAGNSRTYNLEEIDTINGSRELVEGCKTCKLFDIARNSRNVEDSIVYDKEYPYIGFWKINCDDDFGFVFEKVNKGKYSVIFCGPRGCFRKGSRLTKIIGDPKYSVIDINTMIIKQGHKSTQVTRSSGSTL